MGIDPSLMTQFSRFQTFATSNKDNAIATRAGEGGMDIQPKRTLDFVGNIGRTPASKMQNRYVRNLFNDTIKGMFNVSDLRDLPETVLSAMKYEDTFTGKPLTARRIRAVVTVVQDFINDADEIKDRLADAGLRGVGDAEIRAALGACGRDRDAVQFLKNHVELFFCNDKGDQRSIVEVKDKVASLVANLADLRKAANGDKAVFRAGIDFLHANQVDPVMLVSIFGDMVKAAGEIKIDVKGFDPDVSGARMHEAVKQFDAGLDSAAKRLSEQFTARAQVFTGSEKKVKLASLHTFLATAALAKQDGAVAEKMQKTLESSTMTGLLSMYYHLGYEASSGDLISDDPFVPRHDDKDLGLQYLNKPASQARVIEKLMKRPSLRDTGPVFPLAEGTLISVFFLDKALRLRSTVGGNPPMSPGVLGEKFVSSSLAESPIRGYNDSSLDKDSAYAVQKDFLLRAYASVFGSDTTDYPEIRKNILALG